MRSIAFNSGTSNVNTYPINWINHGGEICVDLTGNGITPEIYNKIKDKLIKYKLDQYNVVHGLKSKKGGFLPFLLNMLPAIQTLLPTINKLISGHGMSGMGFFGTGNNGTMDYKLMLMENEEPLHSQNISLLNGVPELIGSGIFSKLAQPIKNYIDKKILDPLADRIYDKIQNRPQIQPMPNRLAPGQEIIGNGFYGEGMYAEGMSGGFIQALLPFLPSIIDAASTIIPSVIDIFKKPKGNGFYGESLLGQDEYSRGPMINRPMPRGAAINSGLTNPFTPIIGLSSVGSRASNITGSSIPINGQSSTIGYGMSGRGMYDSNTYGSGLKSAPCYKSDMYSEY